MPAHYHRRTQLLLDDERWQRVQRRADETGASFGEVIRRAIDVGIPAPQSERSAAIRRLLDAEPIAVKDWDDWKREIRDERLGRAD
jgi:hypothetical protein